MTVLPPAPNWYSAQILNSTNKGYVAYGAKNSIVVLKCKPQSHFCDITNEEKNTIGNHYYYKYNNILLFYHKNSEVGGHLSLTILYGFRR